VIPAFRLLIGALMSRGRLVVLGLLGVIPVLLGVALRAEHLQTDDTVYHSIVQGYGLGLLVPVVSLVFASAALGDPAEDRTLVYVWLKPVPRWQLVFAALAAALVVAVPLAVVPIAVAVSVAGAGVELVRAAVAGTALAAAAYCCVFLGLGLRVRRALAWGFAYVLIWEGAVSHTARGAARLSINVHARSLVARLSHHELPRNASALSTAVIVPVVFAVLAVALTTYWLANADVA
jgi:ABC-2 type transport system permease protein